jgi:hypothetical protein
VFCQGQQFSRDLLVVDGLRETATTLRLLHK